MTVQKRKLFVVVIAVALIVAGYSIYTLNQERNSVPVRHHASKILPPQYDVVINNTFSLPGSNATNKGNYSVECIGHFYVAGNINFTNFMLNFNSGKSEEGFLYFINQNSSSKNANLNAEVVVCLPSRTSCSSGMIYGGHNNYKKSPRGEWGIKTDTEGNASLDLTVCNYAGNKSILF